MTLSECLDITLETMGVSSELREKMGSMDTSAMINQMYFTVTGLLPIFILVVILANGLIAERVDSGSMAYILSTPTKRSAWHLPRCSYDNSIGINYFSSLPFKDCNQFFFTMM